MLDVERQLQTYFEEVTERVTPEDVHARITTVRGARLPDRRLRLRPLAAGAMGFGLAMTLVGVVVVTVRLFGANTSEVTGGPSGATTTGDVNLWMVLPILFGVGFLTAGWITMRRIPIKGGEDMQTMEQVDQEVLPVDNETQRLKRRHRFFAWLSGFLAIAVVALGAWLIFGDSDGQSLTAAQEQMIETTESYLEAWNTGDGAAAAALMTSNGYHDNGVKYYAEDGRLAALVESVHAQDFSVRTADVYVVGNYILTRDFIPEDSTVERPSIFKMTPDGTKIEWHLAP